MCGHTLLAGDDSMVSVRPVLDRWPTFRDLLLEDYEEMFKLMERGGGHRAPAGHGGVRNRTRTSAWQTDCPSGSRVEGRG